jgi:hypothetical protein
LHSIILFCTPNDGVLQEKTTTSTSIKQQVAIGKLVVGKNIINKLKIFDYKRKATKSGINYWKSMMHLSKVLCNLARGIFMLDHMQH